MEVNYPNKKVKKLFDDLNDVRLSKRTMEKQIGEQLTREIKKRFNQIIAFENFYDLYYSKLGGIELLKGNLKGLYSIKITKNYRLILSPITEGNSEKELKECDKITIKGVVDYHGSKENWIIR